MNYNGTMANWIGVITNDPGKYNLSEIIRGADPQEKKDNLNKFINGIKNGTIIL